MKKTAEIGNVTKKQPDSNLVMFLKSDMAGKMQVEQLKSVQLAFFEQLSSCEIAIRIMNSQHAFQPF